MRIRMYEVIRDGESLGEYTAYDAANMIGCCSGTVVKCARLGITSAKGYKFLPVPDREVPATRKCADCGALFTDQTFTMYCPECSCRHAAVPGTKRYKKGGANDDLRTVARKATAAGMSYGEYVAKQFMKGVHHG